jgi:hypothetical protein
MNRVDNRVAGMSFDLLWGLKRKRMKEWNEEKGGGLNGTCYPRAQKYLVMNSHGRLRLSATTNTN